MRILISRPDKIGDVVLALHGAKQLKKLIPESEIFVHVSPYTRKLVENVKFIAGAVSLDEPLEVYNFNAVVDLMAKNETAALYNNSPIDLRVGNAARWFGYKYNRRGFIRRSQARLNEAEYNWQLIRLLDEKLKNTRLTEALDFNDFKQINLHEEYKDSIVIMPGLSVSAYGWPEKYWHELVAMLVAVQQKVLVLLGPAETKLEPIYKKISSDNNLVQVFTTTSFTELLGVLKICHRYIGPSTGVTHLASAMGAEGLALYPEEGSMHPRRWLPFNTKLKPLSLARDLNPQHVFDAIISDSHPIELNPLARQKVSAFVVCCNEERNIRRCLESIKWCDEIIVVDSGSRDKTLEIVKEYTNNIFFRPWSGHSEQKQFALDKCSHAWVLNIDSDEEVSMELKARILHILSQPIEQNSKIQGYDISRIVYFLGLWWDKGGWYPEYRMRFFQKSYTCWGGVNPHEKAIVQGKIQKLSEPIFHYTYRDFAHQIDTLNKHSSQAASCLYDEGKRCRLYNLIINPISRFLKFYVTKLGFREGLPGLLVAVLEGVYTFAKYMKLWEIENEKRLASQENTVLETNEIKKTDLDLASSACNIENFSNNRIH